MKEIVILFPGQGSQYVGMGKDLEQPFYDKLLQADKILNYPLSEIILNGPEEKLQLTENTQPAILAYSLALFEKLQKNIDSTQVKIKYVLGHSVGEYAALCAAGSLSYEDAIKAVHFRGKFMQAATPVGTGSMYAILKVPFEIVEKACSLVSNDKIQVMCANYNEPNQVVISGHTQACEYVVKWFQDNLIEPFKAVELKVSAPFHSTLMKPAAIQLKEFFSSIHFMPNKIDYIANIDAKIYTKNSDPQVIKENLVSQAYGPVRWTQSILNLPDNTIALEAGPSKVLMGLVRKINRTIKVIPLDGLNSFDQIKDELK